MTTERRNISQPADWWEAFEEQAKKDRMLLSAWMGECCIANLPASVKAKLTERQPAHRPRKKEPE